MQSKTLSFLSQINAQHCVPTLVDKDKDNFSLWESRAILTYLVDRVSPGHSLYPTDLQTRATIDRWLYFDAGSIWPLIYRLMKASFCHKVPIQEADMSGIRDKLKTLDDALQGKQYLVGDHLTLADLALVVTLSMLEMMPTVDTKEFTEVTEWKEGLKKRLPYYQEINQKGLDETLAFMTRSNQ